ncbi:hypothetical protein AAF712_005719 [Marasmius tenuissimus]|uniref:Zinc finger Mcm10/DnaG-type domain-containing protein n=1 Tax=Marasmius tenuissimus TaxID=585030 RepID=A0ABR3A293_9AGAR
MESALQKQDEEKQRQVEIRKQILALQSQLKDLPPDDETSLTLSPKRKKKEGSLLVPSTPSPRKRRKVEITDKAKESSSSTQRSRTALEPLNKGPQKDTNVFQQPAASSLLSKLASIRQTKEDAETHSARSFRTTSFTDRPHQPRLDEPKSIPSAGEPSSSRNRDGRLALVEDIEPGPVEHTPPFDDPLFEKLEPNSGIRLSSRTLSHEDLQDHLFGRYYLSPSRLYSSIRLLLDKQGYDVPVPGDWVTIAVVAERGPLKHTSAPVAVSKDDDGEDKNKSKKSDKGKEAAPKGKKYINFKLIDFGSRSGGSSSGGKSVIRGDAFLSLLLFESDGYDTITREGSKRAEKVYKGGSRGAFEAMTKLKEGDVVALLNPRVLKPFQRQTDSPHPVNNILAITPESAASITTIGKCRDLGMCTAVKRDGKVCGSWCDKRVSNVCDYHIQTAVASRKASRPELAGGTSGPAKPKVKNEYDPRRQWGLQPAARNTQFGGTDATYVFSGHVARGSSSSDPFFSDTFGRDAQTRTQKKMEGRESEKVLKKLMERDREGVKGILKAREALGVRKKDSKGKAKVKEGPREGREEASDLDEDSDQEAPQQTRRSNASFQLMKVTGFDSLMAKGGERPKSEDIQKKLDELNAIHKSRKDMVSRPRQAKRPRSAVVPPTKDAEDKRTQQEEDVGEGLIDLDSY